MEISTTRIEELAARAAADDLLKSQAFWDFVANKVSAHAYNAMRIEADSAAGAAWQRAQSNIDTRMNALDDSIRLSFERKIAETEARIDTTLNAAWNGLKSQVDETLRRAVQKAANSLVETHLASRIETLIKKLVD